MPKKLQPGCLAIVKGSLCNDGKIVQCVARIPNHSFRHPGDWIERGVDAWEVTPALVGWSGELTPRIRESCLVPIDNPGDDVKDEFYLNIPDPRFEKAYDEAYGYQNNKKEETTCAATAVIES